MSTKLQIGHKFRTTQFLHSIKSMMKLSLIHTNSREVFITNFYNSLNKFTVCSNINCNLVFGCEEFITGGDDNLLCPACRSKIETHHIVQCTHCESIVDFIEAEPSEEPVVFSIDKCSRCGKLKQQENELTAFYFPDAFM